MTVSTPSPVGSRVPRGPAPPSAGGPRALRWSGPTALLALAVGTGLALRAVESVVKGLWLDEFHTLYVALASDAAGVVDRIKVDFHPPLYFLWVHWLLRVVPLAHAQELRWLSILGGLATLVPLLALGKRMGLSPLARAVVAAIFALAPYQIMFGTELRAYPLLELATVTLVWAAFTDRAPARTRFAVFALATAFGLYHHYLASVAVLAVGAVRLFVRAPGLLPWRSLVAAGTLGVLAFVPWIRVGESWVFHDPETLVRTDMVTPENAAPDGKTVKPGAFFDQDFLKTAVIPLRTVVPRMGSLGGWHAWAARVGAVGFFGTIVAAVGLGLARRRRWEAPAQGSADAGRIRAGVLGTSLASYALMMLACLWFWNRVPEQYFMIAAWGWPLLAGLLVDWMRTEPARNALALALVGTCLVMGIGHAFGLSREDTRGGVRTAVREGGPDALYTCVLWQPPWYADALPLEVYAPGVDSCEPRDVPRASAPGGKRRVVVTTRSEDHGPMLGRDLRRWKTIYDGRELVKSIQVDESTWVHVFEPRDAVARSPGADVPALRE